MRYFIKTVELERAKNVILQQFNQTVYSDDNGAAPNEGNIDLFSVKHCTLI